MQDKTFQTLLNTIYTTQDFHDLVVLLQAFFRNYFFSEHEKIGRKELLKKFVTSYKTSERMMTVVEHIPEDLLDVFDKKNVSSMLEDIQESIKVAPKIVLYIPVILPYVEIKTVGLWFRRNVGKNILMEVRHDPQTIGGCAVVVNGVLHDFSIRYFIKKRKHDITSMIKKYHEERKLKQ